MMVLHIQLILTQLSEDGLASEANKGKSWNLNVECLLKLESLILHQVNFKGKKL